MIKSQRTLNFTSFVFSTRFCTILLLYPTPPAVPEQLVCESEISHTELSGIGILGFTLLHVNSTSLPLVLRSDLMDKTETTEAMLGNHGRWLD